MTEIEYGDGDMNDLEALIDEDVRAVSIPTLADATEEDSAVRKVRNAREQAGIERADNLEMLLRSRGTALSQVGHDRDSKQSDKI